MIVTSGEEASLYVLNSLSITFNVIGSLLLLYHHFSGKRSAHNLLLINMSVINSTRGIVNILCMSRNTNQYPVFGDVNAQGFHPLLYSISIALSLWHLVTIICIVIDRIGSLVFNNNYYTYWSNRKSGLCASGIFVLASAHCVAVGFFHRHGSNYVNKFDAYSKTFLHSTFVVLLLLAYVLIVYKWFASNRISQFSPSLNRSRSNIRFRSRKTSFVISNIILLIYLLFETVPELMLLVDFIVQRTIPRMLSLSHVLLCVMADICAVIVYTFIRDDMRNYLLTKLKWLCCRYRRRHRFDFPDNDEAWPDFYVNQHTNPIIDRILELSTQV